MLRSNWILMHAVLLASTVQIIQGSSVNQEIRGLLEKIPCARLMNITRRYSNNDIQVKSLLEYVRGERFKQHVAEIEDTPEFDELAAVAVNYHVDAYALTEKFTAFLKNLPKNEPATMKSVSTVDEPNTSSTGDAGGVAALLKEIISNTPLGEMKQEYRNKLHANPQLKGVAERIASGEMNSLFNPLLNTKPFQEIVTDLKSMGLCLNESAQIISRTLVDFFDLETNLETEVQELFEMVPYDRVLEICMEYAISDRQVKNLLNYLCSEDFKNNVATMERSDEFHSLADAARVLNIDAYSLARKFITALNALPNRGSAYHSTKRRRRRSPGEGLSALVREAFEITPVDEIKQAYHYKLDKNPQLKMLEERMMQHISTGAVRQYIEPLINSKPFQHTKRDIEALGVPLEQIQEFIELKLTEFFDLGSS